MAEIDLIWYNKKLKPTKKTGFFVYDFGYEKAVEKYSEFFFSSKNLKRWAYWKDMEEAAKSYSENKILKKEIEELKKQNLLLSIANAELQDRFYSMKEVKK